ncbi:MAG: NusG domain II-containing protein [Terriglobia bacterium]
MLTAYDRLLIYLLIVASLLAFGASSYWANSVGAGDRRLVVENGGSVREYGLERPRRFEVRGCTVQIEDGRARVVSSTCPRNICVNEGWIDSPGEVIVCLPHRLVVRIEGGGPVGGVDSVVR